MGLMRPIAGSAPCLILAKAPPSQVPLDPAVKRHDEFIFLPVEIVRGIRIDPADRDDPMWD